MKRLTLIFLLIGGITINGMVNAQENKSEGYLITDAKIVKHTGPKDQYRSGTCWSFSGAGFIEAEAMRLGKGEFDLSEMFAVRKVYEDKAVKHVRLQGHFNFGGGGALNDVIDVMKNYGYVPENVYPGNYYGEEKHVHGEIDNVLSSYVESVIENKNRKLSTAWIAGFKGIVDAYFGTEPTEFEYNGKKYTPRTFVTEALGVNPDDYVLFTSYTHHPFFEKCILEVPDNWSWASLYNVPMDDMIAVINNAVEMDYTVAWASDVSEKGFSWEKGVAIVPTKNIEVLDGLEREKWEKLSENEKQKQLYSFEKPGDEKEITQEMRQMAFDNYETTDDHAMLIVGTAKDQNGTLYYKVKNSWNTTNVYNGYLYASIPYVKYKTMSIMVHKNVVPKEIAKKIKL